MGGVEQTECEIFMFQQVLDSGYEYNHVHLISGVDLPIIPVQQINNYMEENEGVEFISCLSSEQFECRLKYHHLFVRYIRKYPIFNYLRLSIVSFEKLLRVNRLKSCNFSFVFGGNWCSLTARAVREIVSRFGELRPHLNYTVSSDECYKQMILTKVGTFNISDRGNLRYVKFDIKKSSPEILTLDYYDDMKNSGCFWARKFSYAYSKSLIDKMFK